MSKTLFVLLAVFAFLWTPLAHTAEPATVAGRWHFVFDTQGGDRDFETLFEQHAEKVTGKWAITAERKDGDAVVGTFVEKRLTLEFPIESEIGSGTLSVKGALGDDGNLTGDWAFGNYSGSFKATRVAESAPAK